jgi:hypothetical protein
MKALSRILLTVLITVAAVAAPSDASDSTQEQLDARERALEQLWAEYWRTQYRIDAGEEPGGSVQPVRAKINAVLLDEAFLRKLRAEKWSDPILSRRRELFLLDAADGRVNGDPGLVKLVESITKAESAMRYRVGERKLTRAEVNNIVGHDPDRELRRRAWESRRQVTARTGGPIRKAMKMRLALATRYAGRPYPEFMLERKGVDRKDLLRWFEQIRGETEPAYARLLQRMQKELKVDRVRPWDLEYYFSSLTGDFERELFPAESAWTRAQEAAATLGYTFAQLPVTVKIADITFGGGTYPILFGRDVKILVNRYVGLRFTDTMLHESGHALHYSFSDEPSFLLRSDVPEPFDEGLAQVMALMLYRPEIAIGVFGLTPVRAAALVQRYRLQSLYDLRSTMADSAFEFEAYDNPDQDLSKLYAEITSRYLGVEVRDGSGWAHNPFYSSEPIYLQSYVVAEMVGRQIHGAADKRFGHKWDERTGRYLRDSFFSRGARYTLAEIMRRGTGEDLTPKYLMEALRATSTAAP